MDTTINVTGDEFKSTGSMWRAIYDDRFSEEERQNLILSDIQTVLSSDTADASGLTNAKHEYLVLRMPVIKGLLNTVTISKVKSSTKSLLLMTGFPELVTNKKIKGILQEVYEYKGGYEGRLSVKILTESEEAYEHTLDFFDTRYLENCNKYEIGKSYEFYIGALIENIKHRSKDSLEVPLNEYTIKSLGTGQKTISTENMFALFPADDYDTEVFISYAPFGRLHDKTFKHPKLHKNDELYFFELKCHHLDEHNTIYSIPALMSDGVIISSDENRKKTVEFKEGDPVDIVGVLQGHLAAD